MDYETEQRTKVTGAAFKLLVFWLRKNKCSCETRARLKLEGECYFCRNTAQLKEAFPLEFGAACEFIALHPRDSE